MTPHTEIEFEGVTQSISEWAIDYGILSSVIVGRLKKGWSVADAITKPVSVRRGYRLPSLSDRRKADAKTPRTRHPFNLKAMCAQRGVKYGTVISRLHTGMSLEAALTKPVQNTRRGVFGNFPEDVGDRSGVQRARSDENRDFEDEAA